MSGEPDESFSLLSEFRVLRHDESDDLGLVMTVKDGESLRCRLGPKEASDVVAKLLHVARSRAEGRDDNQQNEVPNRLIPLAVNHIEIERGRTPAEALVTFHIGKIGLLLTVDVDGLVGICRWLAEQIEADPNIQTSLQ